MHNAGKKLLSIVLSLLLVIGCFPVVSLAGDVGTLTIDTVTASDAIDIDSDVAFTYEVLINDAPYSGTATGDDGNTYAVNDGKLVLPYNVKATIANIAAGSSYSVKRLGYDNEKYALVGESEVLTGKVAENTYFKKVNGEETEITAAEYAAETNNGANTKFTVYADAEGNTYTADQVGKIGGYDGAGDVSNGDYTYVLDSLEKIIVNGTLNRGGVTTTSKKVGFITTNTHKAEATYSFSCEGYDTVEGSSSGSSSTGKDLARTAAANDAAKAFTSYVEDIINHIKATNEGKLVRHEEKGTLAGTSGYVFGNFSWGGNEDNTSASTSVTVNVFTEILPEDITEYEYRVEYGEADKTASFDVTLTKAPTGEFQINFALNDTVPSGSKKAVFVIKDDEGNVLNGKVIDEDVDPDVEFDIDAYDYVLRLKDTSLEDISKGILKWGITTYRFTNLKAGKYTIEQVGTATGYKIEQNVYSFTVAREDGSVTGDNMDTSALNSKTPCIWNTDKSVNVIVKIKIFLFMNESYTVSFNVKDQNDEPVQGAEFMMLERDAVVELIKQLGSLAINGASNIDFQGAIEKLQGLDLSNIDLGSVLKILEVILDVVSSGTLPEGTKIIVPAIHMATSNEDGLVKFSNSTNILNILATINDIVGAGGDVVDPDKAAETIKNLVGSTVPDEYIDTLVNLVKYLGVLDVHTGLPDSHYALVQTKAPEGYERNATMYTIKVNNDGTASTSAGLLVPVIADAVKDRFDIDIYDILISEEEFENASAEIKERFADFSDYSNFVIDAVTTVIGDNTILGVSAEQLEQIKETLNNAYDDYDDFSDTVGTALKNFNSSINDDFNEDWSYTNTRYFLNVTVNAATCEGDEIAFTVTDADGKDWPISVGGEVSLPYGKYTFAPADELPETYALKEGSSEFTLEINDHNATYGPMTYTYHVETITGAYDPTCTKDGFTGHIVCSGCEAVLEEGSAIPELGHDEIVVPGYEPTCTETGLTDGKYCTRCETTTLEQEEIPANGHTEVEFGEKQVTCFEDGYMPGIKCEVCGEVLEKPELVESSGHIGLTFAAEYTPATCTEWGKDSDVICTMCDTTLYVGDPIEPLGHEYEEEVTPPTCTEQGYTTYTCVREDIEYYDLAAIAEAEANGEDVDVDDYLIVITCNDVQVDDYVDSLGGHVFTDYVSNGDATCTEDGTKTAKCDRDGCTATDTITDEGSALDHSFTNYVSNGDATCTEDGTKTAKCDRCDVTDTKDDEGSALGHSFTNYVSDDNATCTEDGTKTAKCDRCDVTDEKADEGSALGHSFGEWVETVTPNCKNEGVETRYCSRCDALETRTIAIRHGEFTRVTVDPTCTLEGYVICTCQICGYEYLDDIKAPNGHLDKSLDGTCDVCGAEMYPCVVVPGDSFRCSMCDSFEKNKDVPILGIFYRFIHFFVHLGQSIHVRT